MSDMSAPRKPVVSKPQPQVFGAPRSHPSRHGQGHPQLQNIYRTIAKHILGDGRMGTVTSVRGIEGSSIVVSTSTNGTPAHTQKHVSCQVADGLSETLFNAYNR